MTSTVWSRVNVGQLYPPFLTKLREMLDEAAARGTVYFVVSGYRSYVDQNDLYEQGRSRPGKRCTNARGGDSAHNYGVAADLCRDGLVARAGLQPDYRPESYEILRELAPKHGLVWGGSWEHFKDYPHVQLPRLVTPSDLAPLRDRHDAQGMSAVWAYLDQGAAHA